ncbi:MAG: ATP synthase F0 subunit A [Crocinitomicaceae bacterium]|nr:ATP synthase F0 subunit A [Crocinitomicaceae bacterium]
MSNQFEHGHKNVQKDQRVYKLEHGIIKELNGGQVIDLSITKNVTSMIISSFLLFFLLRISANSYKKNDPIPSGIQAFLEPLIIFVKDEIIVKNIGKKHSKYLPFLLTVFFFILINNLLGLLPASANVTGNIAVTLVLSFITFILTTFSGNKNYWSHIFRPPGVPIILLPIMVPIEFLGIFTKPFALMIRLFANISAGHIIILSLISLIFIAQDSIGDIGAWSVAPVSILFVLFISLIEILVAFLQAYIFTLLSAVFIGMAVVEEH